MIALDSGIAARPEVVNLPTYNAGLSSEAVSARFGVTDIARLASNENPFGASPKVVRSLADLASAVNTYPDAECIELRRAIAQRVGATADLIAMGNGSEDLIQMLCQAFLSQQDWILTQSPAFGLHEIYPKMMGATVELLPLTAALQFDVDAWCDALRRRPKIAFICNPSNPVGCMLNSADFGRLIDATSPETLLVVDEAYYEYASLHPDFPDSLLQLKHRGRSWIVLRTFSKAWGLAGLRVGYGIASEAALVQILDKVRTPFNVNCAAQIAALAALQDEAHMSAAVADTVRRRNELRSSLIALDVPGLRVAPSAANFLFVDIARRNEPVVNGLLAQGVIVKPWKEKGFESFIRVSIGTGREVARFLSALRNCLSDA